MRSHRIVIVDDEPDIRSVLRDILCAEGYEVDLAADAAQARVSVGRANPDLILLDIWMPGTDGIALLREWMSGPSKVECPIVIVSGHGNIATAVEATRLGAFDFLEKPPSLSQLLQTVKRALDRGHRRQHPAHVPLLPPIAVVGRSRVVQKVREEAERIAAHDVPVLLLGERGTGRAACAQYIHSLSSRSARAFVSVAAGSLADDAATALHGAGAACAPGKYQEAEGGTLFINGLEDLIPTAQRVLLADIKNGRYSSADDTGSRPLNVRFLSSAEPGFEVRGEPPFRADLLWHLNVVTLRVPSLREYAEDVPDLLCYYVDRLADEAGLPFRRFSIAAQNRLRHYSWPGNLQELQNLVQRLLILNNREEIDVEEIDRELSQPTPLPEPPLKQNLLSLPLREAREQFERAFLQQQLLLCNGKVEQFARSIGMDTTRAYCKIRSLGLSLPLREARQRFERAYLRQQLLLCEGRIEQLAKRVGMERTHLYRKLHSLGVDFRRTTRQPRTEGTSVVR
ncbi:MAG TPA: sigma-54 dependent transcriptional regulator [Burkholderiales bacterium]|nr:sigma-54 dependent transcriptional regulator [Burkholderiales bacterium]